MPCSIAPQSASDAPTVAAMQTRGSRNCQTIAWNIAATIRMNELAGDLRDRERRPADEQADCSGRGHEQRERDRGQRFHRLRISIANERPGIGYPA